MQLSKTEQSECKKTVSNLLADKKTRNLMIEKLQVWQLRGKGATDYLISNE